MPRKIEINEGNLKLTESKVEGFLERTINKIGTSAKADVPRRYLGKRAYVIIIKD